MAAETPRNLRDELAALRIDRSSPPSVPRGRKPLWLGLGIGAALVALALLGWLVLSGGPREVVIGYARRIEAGGTAPVMPVLSGSGYVVTADKYVSIGVRVPGRIVRYLVDEADHVVAGQALVQLDDRDYRAALESTEAGLRVARANADLHRLELDRLVKLRERDYASQSELDVKRTQLSIDRAQIAQLEAQIATAQVNLDYTILRAPSDGVILAKLKEVGEIAVPGGFAGSGDLIRLANLSRLRAEVDISEADLSRVKLGQPAQVIPDAYPDKRFAAAVVKLYPQVNRQKGTLKVEVEIAKPDPELLPDMSVRIHFLSAPPSSEAGGAPLVLAPASAVRSDAEGAFVWAVTDGRVRRQAIRTGVGSGENAIVLEGLAGGEALVLGEVPELEAGDEVRTASHTD